MKQVLCSGNGFQVSLGGRPFTWDSTIGLPDQDSRQQILWRTYGTISILIELTFHASCEHSDLACSMTRYLFTRQQDDLCSHFFWRSDLFHRRPVRVSRGHPHLSQLPLHASSKGGRPT